MGKKKIIMAGHICIDFTPEFVCGKQKRLEDILAPGKLINVGKAHFHPGGAVSNSGLAMKFLGADVSLMGKIGKDAFGTMILNELEKHGAAGDMIVVPGQETSYTVAIAIPGVDRVFLHNTGANDTFTSEDIDYEKCKDAALFHFGYPSLMAQMNRNGGRELTAIFSKVKECGCMTSLDMAAMDVESEAAKADWDTLYKNTLPYVDFFLPSIEEMLFTMNRKRYFELLDEADGRDMTEVISIERDVVPCAERLLDMGCKIVVLKCGAPGFYYRTAEHEAFAELEKTSGIDFSTFAGKEGFQKSFVPDKVVSGTGAGDTTIAAFLTAMTEGYPFEKCLQFAAGTGACCVSAADAFSGLKSFKELEEKIEAGWELQN